ncbi:MAG: DUF115 domain-containing protein [Treponema sp.]|nr:DUF115 domain-containing protein [Treponema sp.]
MVDSTGHVDVPAARLHSGYRPQAEADRYIEALNLRHDIDYFILIEPGLGYLISALSKHRPGSKVIILHADSSFRSIEGNFPGIPAWYPDSGMGVQVFLENEIPDTAIIQIIEWRPSLRVFGDACAILVRESAEFIKRAAASRRTTAAFGRRWVRNFFRNLTVMQNTVMYRVMEIPVVIIGSGPSLEAALPQINACRDGIFIIAASSSLPALAAGGITPDMVISTDGGGWALSHLHGCFRAMGSNVPPPDNPDKFLLACSLSAAIPSQCSAVPLLLMNDGSLWQSMALNAAGIPSVLIPQRGTVTASALELAIVLSSGNIFLAGMDFAVSDIKSHARPYGFDNLFSGRSSRFLPVYSQYFMRSNDITAGGSHDVYAAWFNSRIALLPGRIFSLGGNHANLENRLPQKTPAAGMHRINRQEYFKVIDTIHEDRCGRAAETITAALHDSRYADTLSSELAPLLFPLQAKVTAGEIAGALHNLTHKYRRTGCG